LVIGMRKDGRLSAREESVLYRALQIAESYSYTVEQEDPACEIANDVVDALRDLIGVACRDDD
jgi:hypothetical protein